MEWVEVYCVMNWGRPHFDWADVHENMLGWIGLRWMRLGQVALGRSDLEEIGIDGVGLVSSMLRWMRLGLA